MQIQGIHLNIKAIYAIQYTQFKIFCNTKAIYEIQGIHLNIATIRQYMQYKAYIKIVQY